MSLDFRLLGCFHAQRSHPLNFIAMEMDVHRYPHPLTDDPMNKIFYFLNQNQDIFKFVKNYFLATLV